MRRTCILVLLVATGGAVLNTAVWSQSPTPPAAPKAAPALPNAPCAPGIGAESPTVGSGQPNLSDRLARSGGVICPPATKDSEMAVPPPATGGAMPVIPPPGTPGGDQSVQPK